MDPPDAVMENPEPEPCPRIKSNGDRRALRPGWRWAGERALQLATGEATLAYYQTLSSLNFAELEDIVPADGSLLLIFKRNASVSARLLTALAAPPEACRSNAGRLHEIVVEYGGAAGPDLPAVADQAGIDVASYIARHAAVEYTVAFVGFQPGFPYLCGLPDALHAPRRASPRVRVPAGSVAVGGPYTGMYPASGPGGWQLIGRTRARLFDPRREAPVLLMPGDRVRLLPR